MIYLDHVLHYRNYTSLRDHDTSTSSEGFAEGEELPLSDAISIFNNDVSAIMMCRASFGQN